MKFNAVKSANKSRLITVLASAFGLLGIALTPVTAQAGGSLHLDLPGISIGVHDHQYKKKRYRRVYRNNRGHRSRHRNYRNDHYYDDYKPRRYERRRSNRYYYNRGYNNRYNDRYNYRYNNGYNNDYYYGGRSNRNYNNRRVEVCPINGYSPYYDDNLRCTRHKDHFHCS